MRWRRRVAPLSRAAVGARPHHRPCARFNAEGRKRRVARAQRIADQDAPLQGLGRGLRLPRLLSHAATARHRCDELTKPTRRQATGAVSFITFQKLKRTAATTSWARLICALTLGDLAKPHPSARRGLIVATQYYDGAAEQGGVREARRRRQAAAERAPVASALPSLGLIREAVHGPKFCQLKGLSSSFRGAATRRPPHVGNGPVHAQRPG